LVIDGETEARAVAPVLTVNIYPTLSSQNDPFTFIPLVLLVGFQAPAPHHCPAPSRLPPTGLVLLGQNLAMCRANRDPALSPPCQEADST
jgi:hypothetical protein